MLRKKISTPPTVTERVWFSCFRTSFRKYVVAFSSSVTSKTRNASFAKTTIIHDINIMALFKRNLVGIRVKLRVSSNNRTCLEWVSRRDVTSWNSLLKITNPKYNNNKRRKRKLCQQRWNIMLRSLQYRTTAPIYVEIHNIMGHCEWCGRLKILIASRLDYSLLWLMILDGWTLRIKF